MQCANAPARLPLPRSIAADSAVGFSWSAFCTWREELAPHPPQARQILVHACKETVTQFLPLGAMPPSARRHPKAARKAAWLYPVGVSTATCASFATKSTEAPDTTWPTFVPSLLDPAVCTFHDLQTSINAEPWLREEHGPARCGVPWWSNAWHGPNADKATLPGLWSLRLQVAQAPQLTSQRQGPRPVQVPCKHHRSSQQGQARQETARQLAHGLPVIHFHAEKQRNPTGLQLPPAPSWPEFLRPRCWGQRGLAVEKRRLRRHGSMACRLLRWVAD